MQVRVVAAACELANVQTAPLSVPDSATTRQLTAARSGADPARVMAAPSVPVTSGPAEAVSGGVRFRKV